MRLSLILNELSMSEGAPSLHVGRQWMHTLQQTASRAFERGFEEALLVHTELWSASLAEGYTFSHWSNDPEVELELRQIMLSWVTCEQFIEDLFLQECEDRMIVTHEGNIGYGLGLALVRDHAVVSMGVDPWQAEDDEVVVVVQHQPQTGGPVDEAQRLVRNLHCSASVDRRLRWIAERCCVKPRYDNPGTHDPTSGVFRGGGAMTTLLPPDAEEVYKTALPSNPRDGTSPWWGINADNYLYRYQPSWPGPEPVAHWNGTTDPASARAIEDRVIPASIREAFPERRR